MSAATPADAEEIARVRHVYPQVFDRPLRQRATP